MKRFGGAFIAGVALLVAASPAQAHSDSCDGRDADRVKVTDTARSDHKGTIFFFGDNGSEVIEGSNRDRDADRPKDGIKESDGDVIFANGGNDLVCGRDGFDTIYGDSDDTKNAPQGKDKLFGDEGDDDLTGYNKDDKLFGGVGDDILNGGGGDDLLDGGPGDDICFDHGSSTEFRNCEEIEDGSDPLPFP